MIKKREQIKKHQQVTYDNWERLEIQLRGNESKDWQQHCLRILDAFKIENLQKLKGVKDRAYIVLTALNVDPDIMNSMSKKTQADYRKLIKNNEGYDTTYSDLAKIVLNNKLANLQEEINYFLSKKGTENTVI